MATRRQAKVARVVREAVSDAIARHLSDPRIEGFVSVTRVEMAPNLRNAEVYISVLAKNQATKNKTFIAIKHAKSRIQSILARRVHSKFCPILHFHEDDNLKKTMETIKLINQAVSQYKEKEEELADD